MQDADVEDRIRRDPRSFGRRVLQLHMGSRMASAELAARAGLTAGQLEAVEDGRTEVFLPSAADALRLAAALGVTTEDLFEPPA